ncbi:Nonribosomal peptide synthetase 1 [Penicillium subrubescens]|uniref:Nonribosomal peptide synthetase 1 n=1 Tax=Penicillium subrubescens TaxID=1316194 RepID=A0A1Q5SNG6_9EURO|nr:Nonribosomal peptide synthetase 1 [Penicillium subrubescens]
MKERGEDTISGAKLSHSRHVCTASLKYLTKSFQLLTPLTSLTGNLELVVIRRDNRLSASIKKPENVPNELDQSMLWTFQHVLRQITSYPASLKLEAIDYCSESHKKIIKSQTNTISAQNLHCLHDLILENCQRHPKRLAVRSFDGDLTYEELNILSLRLALHLAQLGVRPETFVLSSFQKSTWAIVARLAILRAGGAYISIHSSNPPAYLNSVIRRTGAKVMLSDPVFADQFHNAIETVIVITPEWLQTLPLQIQLAPLQPTQPFNACTILFTSGSTGRPKAIVQEHSPTHQLSETMPRTLA